MEARERERLRARAQGLTPAVQVGKGGLSPGIVEEARRQLEEHRLVKVKLLATSRERAATQDLAKELAELAGAELVEVRGHTAVLWKGKGRRKPGPAAP